MQLPIKFLISVRCKMLPLEKRILRDTPELAGQLAGSSSCTTKYETQAGAVSLSVLSSVTFLHLTGTVFDGQLPIHFAAAAVSNHPG
jgi:hypothetical protein